MLKAVERRVVTMQIEGCSRPRRVHTHLCEYLDVPYRGEILLEVEPYIAEDLREMAANTDKYDAESRRMAGLIADKIDSLHGQYDYLWLTY